MGVLVPRLKCMLVVSSRFRVLLKLQKACMRSKKYLYYRSKAWRWENSRYLWLPTLRFWSWFQVKCLRRWEGSKSFWHSFPPFEIMSLSPWEFHEKISCFVMTFWGMLSHNFKVEEWKVFTRMWSKHIMKRIGVFLWNVHRTTHLHVRKNGLLYGCLS